MKKLARLLGILVGVAAVVWAMRDRLISIAAPREPEPPRFRVVTPPSEPTPAKGQSGAPDDLTTIVGIGPVFAERLSAAGIDSFQRLLDADPSRIAEITGATASRVEDWLAQAGTLTTA